MTSATLVFASALRHKMRAFATIFGVAVSMTAFLFVRTIDDVWTVSMNTASEDILYVMRGRPLGEKLPLNYLEKIRAALPELKLVAPMMELDAAWLGNRNEPFYAFATDARIGREIFRDYAISDEDAARWFDNPSSVIVGATLARSLGWKIGQRLSFAVAGRGVLEVDVAGIYRPLRRGTYVRSILFHYPYVNAGAPPTQHDRADIFATKVTDPSRRKAVISQIDELFAAYPIATKTVSEKALALASAASMGLIFRLVDVISLAVLLVMLSIIGNMIALSVSERTREYATLRALGFQPLTLAVFVLSESLTLVTIGATIGIVAGRALVNAIGETLVAAAPSFFNYFEVPSALLFEGVALCIGLATLATIVPALTAARVPVVNALRRAG